MGPVLAFFPLDRSPEPWIGCSPLPGSLGAAPGAWAGRRSSRGDALRFPQGKITKGSEWSSSQPGMPGVFALVWPCGPRGRNPHSTLTQGGPWTKHRRPSRALGDSRPPPPSFCHTDSGLSRHKEHTGRRSTCHTGQTSKDQPSRTVLPVLKIKITSPPIRFYETCFAPVHSLNLCWNLPLSSGDKECLSLPEAILSLLSLSQQWAVLFQSRGQRGRATVSPAPCQLPADTKLSSLGLHGQLRQHLTISWPLPPAWVIVTGAQPRRTFSFRPHAGVLRSPPEFVCRTSSLIITKLDSGDHVQTLPIKPPYF